MADRKTNILCFEGFVREEMGITLFPPSLQNKVSHKMVTFFQVILILNVNNSNL